MSTVDTLPDNTATVVVIGAGQAGLSAGYHLAKRGFVSAQAHPSAPKTFVVLDANAAPGGAWQHRWHSLTMATVNGIFDLPGFPKPPLDPALPSSVAVPQYFADFERERGLPIVRPVTVTTVFSSDDDRSSDLVIDTNAGRWRARALINATGTWNNPLLPTYPGQDLFAGRQLHTRDYVDANEFRGQRVGIIGGGISAVQHLEEISRVATTFWYTRREPVFLEGNFRPEVEGREVIARVTSDAEAGKPPGSIVSYTGLGWTPYAIAAKERGVLNRSPMFTAIVPRGVREPDSSVTELDAILWATGFRPDLQHLDPLYLRNEHGGIKVNGTQVVADPRIHLIGYGPSQSTVGANRAGRAAARILAQSSILDT